MLSTCVIIHIMNVRSRRAFVWRFCEPLCSFKVFICACVQGIHMCSSEGIHMYT